MPEHWSTRRTSPWRTSSHGQSIAMARLPFEVLGPRPPAYHGQARRHRHHAEPFRNEGLMRPNNVATPERAWDAYI